MRNCYEIFTFLKFKILSSNHGKFSRFVLNLFIQTILNGSFSNWKSHFLKSSIHIPIKLSNIGKKGLEIYIL